MHVVVLGDGDTDLDLYIMDSDNKTVTKDIRGYGGPHPADLGEVVFIAPYTGEYTIRVINLG